MTKQYLNMTEVLADRVLQQINDNGDERIDHDEFVGFMLQVAMGTKIQKLMIAFRMYDFDRNQQISMDEVNYIMTHVPHRVEQRYGISFDMFEQEACLPKQTIIKNKLDDIE